MARRDILNRSKCACSLTALVLVIAGSACARVGVFTDPEFKHRTGIRMYPSAPYVLLVRTGAADKPIEVSVIHLPDLENPQFLRFYSGLGSQNTSLTLTGGVLSSFGYQSDSKIPETIGAVADIAKDVIGAAARVSQPPVQGGTAPTFELYRIVSRGGKILLVRVCLEGTECVP